ncbi:hypothetical protein Plim_0073 [Planctopirus limnophila DSM 3776]|uniref:Carboxypeptidase regulatory-like domain-containing protein n=1 Tax=Planctopirus limnophila (strain ATCC 43296 / DSM 3776 / IFAM 1008 / Mu 290) TaxID=521674 RepID=D5SMK6_PLAL2|nr:carboxypeptidase-like regulatory domain-containing protein [Planctopirus limnophila]ADG65926.1 hypothetical protein Plim_0073 [Planctopirus limnophila DSM 3776]
MFRSMFVAFVCSALLMNAGCGSADRGPQAQLTGKVTFSGQPVPEGVVQLSKVGGGAGASANISADGSFSVVLVDPLPPGEYLVLIVPPTIEDNSNPNSPPVQKPKEMEQIPPRYGNAKTSPLKVTLKEGANTADFALEPEKK